jgi:hypothetical protein
MLLESDLGDELDWDPQIAVARSVRMFAVDCEPLGQKRLRPFTDPTRGVHR